MLPRRLLPLHAWLAILAIVAGALAPSISHLLGATRGVAWAEVCSIDGPRAVTVGAADAASPEPAAAHALEHCLYCSAHAPTLDLPSTGPALSAPALSHTEAPPRALDAPRTRLAWASAQARAPPAHA